MNMGGGWNYKRLRQLSHKHRNLSQMEEAKRLEQHPYPKCRGTFTDCPIEQEFQEAIEKDKANPPDRCKECWIFKESKFSKSRPYTPSEGVLKLLQEAKK